MGIDEVRVNYSAVGINVIEQLYGDDFLSFSGTETTDVLAERAEIGAGTRVLDVGCGLGGPAFHLAETWGAIVTGVDLVELNIDLATERSSARGLSDRVQFRVANALDLPFADEEFDVVFGQDAWCHVPGKRELMAECSRLVRPGGFIAFSDWLQIGPMDADLESAALAASATADLVDIAGYCDLLAENGFVDSWVEDTSDLFVARYREVMAHLDAKEGPMTEQFGPKIFSIVKEKNGNNPPSLRDWRGLAAAASSLTSPSEPSEWWRDLVPRFLAVLAVFLGVASPAGTPEGSIADFIESEMAASGAPGLVYAVVADGETTSVEGHGVVRTGGDTAVTPETPFLTGSISKSFTALAIMQLVEAGDVELDTEISQYLDGFENRPTGAITIQQLLGHTSGFSTLQGNASHTDGFSGSDELARSVEELAEVEPAYEPGGQWEYSNTNYQLLGRVIEVVSGHEYQVYVAANILEPVGMEHSFVADGEIHESMATGHTPWFGTKRPLGENATHRATAPQGGIVSSGRDLARYMQMMMNDEDDVLSAEGKALMMQPASGESPYYGFGWYLDSANGSVWHSGASPGFETLLTMVPSQNRGAVVLVNGGSGMGFGETTQLRKGITARALGLDYDGEGSRWSQKAIFSSLVLLPIIYLLSMIWAWRRRAEVRAKSGIFGLFSWWVPLVTTLVSAWVILWLIPNLFGVPLRTPSPCSSPTLAWR